MATTQTAVKIENVVASTDIDRELDLDELQEDLGAADFNRDQFPGLIYRQDDPRVTCLVFRSGKIVCTGAASFDDIDTAFDNLFAEFRKLGITIDDPDIGIQNVVSSGDVGDSLNLNAIAIGLGLENVEYEPEQFPGLVYRLAEPDVVALLFGSGKLIITGATARSEADAALEHVKDELTHLDLI